MKTLVIGPAWVGDMVMAHGLVQLLAREAAIVELVAPPATAPLGRRMPELAAVHELDVPHGVFGLGRRHRLGSALRGRGFEQAIVLPNSWKSALLPCFARIPLRRGWRGEWRFGLLNDLRREDPACLPRQVDRYAALAMPAGAGAVSAPSPRLRSDAQAAAALERTLGLAGDGPVLACCPGAEFGPAKRWPPEAFAALARRRIAAGWRVWLFGSAADAAATAAILEALDPQDRCRVQDLAGRTSLLEALDLLARCDAAVSNDSGLMHLAGAVGVPVVGLFGSTSPDVTPPLAQAAETVTLSLPCSPCYQRNCPLGHFDCLRRLPPEQVEAALDAVLVRAGGSS